MGLPAFEAGASFDENGGAGHAVERFGVLAPFGIFDRQGGERVELRAKGGGNLERIRGFDGHSKRLPAVVGGPQSGDA